LYSVPKIFENIFDDLEKKKPQLESMILDCFSREGWFQVEIANILRLSGIRYLVEAPYPGSAKEGKTNSGDLCDICFEQDKKRNWLELKAIPVYRIGGAKKRLDFENKRNDRKYRPIMSKMIVSDLKKLRRLKNDDRKWFLAIIYPDYDLKQLEHVFLNYKDLILHRCWKMLNTSEGKFGFLLIEVK
jgi:hypothetical protein